jgi:hypothetical protein
LPAAWIRACCNQLIAWHVQRYKPSAVIWNSEFRESADSSCIAKPMRSKPEWGRNSAIALRWCTEMQPKTGRGFLAPGCKCSFYFKCNLSIFWIVKKFGKMLHVHLHNLCMRQVVSRKSDSSRGLAKTTNFGGKIRVCIRFFFCLFYSQYYKYRFIAKLGHAYLVCRDVHAKFLFRIFSHFQIYFLNKVSICSLDQICISS